ncbi:hypothetical protein [Rhizobium sp.]|uniref:hypothetical protein n=1 Tax=Rhizobium sp. TaxID=391 RepID=UPI0028A7ED5B
MIQALRDVVAATTTIAAIAAEYQPTCFLKFSLKSRVSNFLSFGDKNDPITVLFLFDVSRFYHARKELQIRPSLLQAWLAFRSKRTF